MVNMLEELELRDLGPIETATIDPAPSMTAITGETGAGKSMLLNALRMISGAPADTRRVAPGASQAWAQGIFLIDAQGTLKTMLDDAGIDVDDDELFLSRTIPARGRSRAVLSGKTVPRAVQADIAAQLVTIHGQADQLRLASTARQRAFLDRYARNGDLRATFAKAYNEYENVCERLHKLNSQEASMRQQADYLKDSIERINRVNPKEGELDELLERRDRIEHATQIASGVERALADLDPSQFEEASESVGVTQLIANAAQALRSIQTSGTFAQLADRLDAASADIDDIVFSLSRQLDEDVQSGDLDVINERIHELNELTGRWGPKLSDVIAWRDQAMIDVEDLDASPEQVRKLEEERDARHREALTAARDLSKSRARAARSLCKRVKSELAQLAMAGAQLDIVVNERQGDDALDSTGVDTIEFLFTPFPGSQPLPMGTSASGGELSRLMLALELCASDVPVQSAASDHGQSDERRQRMTFIFDEVDAGVGGKAAVELGRRLAQLAQHEQVIVVTHLPQVASWASRQYVVGKETQGNSTHTSVHEVSGDDRVREIARMLAGSESETSLDHARELLEQSVLEQEP